MFPGIKAIMYGLTAYKLCDRGLSNALALEELPHGTDPISNMKIRVFGGQPSKPGYKPNYPDYDNTVGYFYVYKDSEYGHIQGKVPKWEKNLTPLMKIWSRVGKEIDRSIYLADNASNATILQVQRFFNIPLEELVKEQSKIRAIAILGIILSPNLRFRFAKIDPKRWEEDINHPGYAYKTSDVVEPWRLGIIGSCLAGLNYDWADRVVKDPQKAIMGFAQLAAGAALLACKGAHLRAKLPFAIAGALFA